MLSKKSFLVVCILILSISANAAKRQVPAGQYYAGGVLSIIPGFGIGHAVQERYKEIGWVFTVSEVGCLALISVGVAWTSTAAKSGMFSTAGSLFWISGSAGLLGFRIWEIVDAWTGAVPIESKHASLFLNTDENRDLALKQASSQPIFNFLSVNF